MNEPVAPLPPLDLRDKRMVQDRQNVADALPTRPGGPIVANVDPGKACRAMADLMARAPKAEYAPMPTPAKPANPKQAFGDKKPPLSYFPLSALLAGLEALYDGKLKYGANNWREINVEAMTYVDGLLRHAQLYKVGEGLARDTLVKNLGAVIACAAILIDAEAHGTLIDNRPISAVEADLLHEAEAWVARLKDMQAERERQKASA